MGDLKTAKHPKTNFSRHEVWCNCGCKRGTPHPLLLDNVQDYREYTASPSYCNTHGHRGGSCAAWNEKIGGATDSEHKLDFDRALRLPDIFYAMDLETAGLDALESARIFEHLGLDIGGLGIYYQVKRTASGLDIISRFFHYDIGNPVNENGVPRKWVHFDFRMRMANQNTSGAYRLYHWVTDFKMAHSQLVDLAEYYYEKVRG